MKHKNIFLAVVKVNEALINLKNSQIGYPRAKSLL
jgi:hypothetical protein